MIKLILIIAYVVVFGASAVIFLFYGRKKGWRGGAAVMISAAAAFVGSLFLAPLLAYELMGIQPVKELAVSIAGAAAERELDSAVFVTILSDVMQRILEIPSAIVLYILFFIVAFVLTRTVMKLIKPKKAEPEKSSRLIGAALGAAAPVIVAVLTLFVSKIDLFREAGSVDAIMELTSKPTEEMVAQLCSDPDRYTGILFETTLTSADENQRLELINKSVSALVLNADDQLLIRCFDGFEGYTSRSGFEEDIRTGAELYGAFDGIGLFGEGELAPKVFAVADKGGMAQSLYRLSFKDCIVRYIISYAVHGLADSRNFVYPDDTEIPGTYEDFAQLVTMAGEFENGEISRLDLIAGLRESPLLPTELYAEIMFGS